MRGIQAIPGIPKRRCTNTLANFELCKEAKGEIRWRLIASNGQMIANSGEGYKSKDGAKSGIESVKKNAASATIEDKA